MQTQHTSLVLSPYTVAVMYCLISLHIRTFIVPNQFLPYTAFVLLFNLRPIMKKIHKTTIARNSFLFQKRKPNDVGWGSAPDLLCCCMDQEKVRA